MDSQRQKAIVMGSRLGTLPSALQKAAGWAACLLCLLFLPGIAGAQTSFGTENLGSTTTDAVTVTVQTAGTLGSVAVVTQGAPNLEFTDASGGSCTEGTAYTAGQTCTVNVTFKPLYLGMSYGAVELLTGSGALLATSYVEGTGVGPQVSFLPGRLINLGIANPGATGYENPDPEAAAADVAGNIYIADAGNSVVYKATRSAGTYTTSLVADNATSGVFFPFGVAVDGAGNVYIADTSNSRVLKETLLGGNYTQSVVADAATNGLHKPYGVAVDGSGNVYIADTPNNRVLKETVSASGYTQSVVASTGLNGPYGLAVDSSGNVYIADTGNSRVLMETASAGSYVQSVVANSGTNGLSSPRGVAVDGMSNVYIVDSGNCRVLEETPSGDGWVQSLVTKTNDTIPQGPHGVSVDGSGNVFIPDWNNEHIWEFDIEDAPSQTFAATVAGESTAAEAWTLTNTGESVLTIAGIAMTGADPYSFEFSDTCGTSLAVGANCTVHGRFAPGAVGALNAAISITDDGGNSPQAIALSGTGLAQVSLSATSLSFGLVLVGNDSGTQSVTVTNAGVAAVSITSITVTGANPTSFAFGNNCGTSLAGGATCTIHGHFAPTATGLFTAAIKIADSSRTSPQIITVAGTGLSAATPVTFSPASLSFGSVAVGQTSASQTVTMMNTGTQTFLINSVGVTGTNAASFVFASDSGCEGGLGPGQTCTIHGHFAPTTMGALTAAVTVTVSTSTSPQSFAVSGTGVVSGNPVTLTATSLTYPTTTVGTSSGSQYVTLTNTGSAALTITSIAVTGTNASSFVFANNCGTSLAVGANCLIHGHFAPTVGGALTAAVIITDSAATSPQSIALSGTGVEPPWTFSASSLNFPPTDVGGTSASQIVTVTNTSPVVLSLCCVVPWGSGAFASTNTCAGDLAVGASCAISVNFSPTYNGAYDGIVTLEGYMNTTYLWENIVLNGTGITPLISLSATSLTFGSTTVGTPAESQSVTLTNNGTNALLFTSIAVTGTNAAEFAFANNCGTALAPGSSCTIHGHFSPTALGAASASITITDNALNSPQSISLTGTGAAATSGVTLSGTSLPAGSTSTNLVFGPVVVGSASPTDYVILTNTGSAALSISGIAVTGANASQFAFSNSCGTSLAAGASCNIQGHFAPTAAGSMTASVTITDSDATSPQTIALSGTGVAASGSVTLSATSLSYPAMGVGTASGSESVTMTNSGTLVLTITSISLAGADPSSFVFANNCGASLTAGASCTIHGHFAPVSTGALTATVTIVDSATGSPQTIALSGASERGRE